MNRVRNTVMALIAICLFLPSPSSAGESLADLGRFPQRASAYINGDADEPITSYETQKIYAEEYLRFFFAPWQQSDLSYLDLDEEKILAFQRQMLQRKFFSAEGKAIAAADIQVIRENTEVAFGVISLPGIAIADADVRVLPTAKAFFPSADSAQGLRGLLRQDTLQNSTLKPGEPLRILHRSRDSAWCYIASGGVVGWVQAGKVASVDDDFIDRWMYADHAVIIKDNLQLNDRALGLSTLVKMGTVLPREGSRLWFPVQGERGMAVIRAIPLEQPLWSQFPLPFTPRNAGSAVDRLMGEPYGWGGVSGLRDCSAMTRDYFALFGIWLPRNSSDQAKAGARIPLGNVAPKDRARVILERATPFASLIQMPGHIMLYIGEYDSEPAVFHNIWGVKVNRSKGKSGRVVVGRAAVTGLRLGSELENRPKESLLIDRVSVISFPVTNPW